MSSQLSPASLDGGRGANYMRRDHFEVNQYVRVQVAATRFAIGVVTAIDEDHDKATVETRNGYEVTLPTSALHRAFLVVLDLNGVLVARGRGSFILRPHVQEFLKFVFANFVVAVWTSGLQRSSNPIIEHVFGSYRDLLLFTLFRDACVPKATAENPYGTEKNLQTIFDRYPLSFHAVNTIIIDDSPDKCSHPDIALCPVQFKDPVAQSQDDGLLATMETLRQVLLLDSCAPLILAAEERLHRLEKERQKQQQQQEKQPQDPQQKDSSQTESATVPSAAASPLPVTPSVAVPASDDYPDSPADMKEVELWKTRLCCEYLLAKCTRGLKCPFSHDPDDGRPCSRKSGCRYHGSRWPKTNEEAAIEARKRQIREAKQQQYRLELERRQHEQRQHQRNNNRNRGQNSRASDLLHQLPQQQQQSSSSSSSPSARRQRSGGGRRRRQGRPSQQQPQLQHRGGRGGRQHDEEWGEGEEEDWASGSTGLSHTGDPAYDNMINEQQRRHRPLEAGTAGRSCPSQRSNTVSTEKGSHEQGNDMSGHFAVGGYNNNNQNNSTARGTLSLSFGYRHQLEHSSKNSNTADSTNGQGGYGQGYEQQRQQEKPIYVGQATPFFFHSCATTSTTATFIEPFSTRPIAPVPTTSQQPSTVHTATSQTTAAAAPAVSLSFQNSIFGTGGNYRGYPQLQQPQTQHNAPSSSTSPQSQAIHISGCHGDSNAVVSQLQALMRKH